MDGHNELDLIFPAGGCWEGASAEQEKKMSIHDGTKTFVHLLKDGNFYVRRGFCLLPKRNGTLCSHNYFVYCGMDRIFFLYFLFNDHTQFFFFFWFVYCYSNHFKTKKTVCVLKNQTAKKPVRNLILVSVGEIN
jgi:hypothetical protein